jgi:hypothetical protein
VCLPPRPPRRGPVGRHRRPHHRHLLRRRHRHAPQPRRLHRPTPANAHRVSRVEPPPPSTQTPPHYAVPAPSPPPASTPTTPGSTPPKSPPPTASPQPAPSPASTTPSSTRPTATPFLTPATVTTPQSDALDQTLGVHTRFGLGYALPSTTFPLFGADSFGHGGSLGAAHPPTRTTIGYVMNHMHTGLTTDRRFTNLATAITTSL